MQQSCMLPYTLEGTGVWQQSQQVPDLRDFTFCWESTGRGCDNREPRGPSPLSTACENTHLLGPGRKTQKEVKKLNPDLEGKSGRKTGREGRRKQNKQETWMICVKPTGIKRELARVNLMVRIYPSERGLGASLPGPERSRPSVGDSPDSRPQEGAGTRAEAKLPA